MKRLIIAEKPSLMRTIIHALETEGEHFSASSDKEYFESQHYVATAQFGHLLELKMTEEYEGHEGLSWNLANLPFFPQRYEYKVKDDTRKRYNTIGKLLKRPDIDTVIHCGDPDREGQILIDLVLRNHNNKKPVIRPQLKALTDEAILDALRTARPNTDYRNVFNEGMTRMCFDWDFGINLSQYATLKTNARPALNIGRVIGAIVTEIYNRDVSIENFVPEEYFKVVSDVAGGFKLTSKRKFSGSEKADADEYARRLQAGDSVVTDVQKKRVTKKPPKLFSQTALQAAMSKKHNYKPEKTLELAQSLYEKGFTSYPRTNTEYIAEAEKENIRDVIARVNRDGHLAFRDDKAVFDDSKIDGHSAITITGKRPAGLSDDEMNCYKVVVNRFFAVFCKEKCLYDKTTVTIDNPLEQFKVSGEVAVQPGWQRFEPPARKKAGDKDENDHDKDEPRALPPVKTGDKVETDFKAVSAETKPPAHYSVESLGKWMQNPFRKEDSTDDEDYKAILSGLEVGTEATRASILKKATEKGYISLKKKAYHIEPRGRFLVESCRALGIDFSARMTADMGRQLKAVGKGEAGIMDVLTANRNEVARVIQENRDVRKDSSASGGAGEYAARGKTDAQVYAPTGEEIRFNKTWGSHEFTEKEIATLLAGEAITFSMKSKKGHVVDITGRLCKQSYKGQKFWGFKMDVRDFPEEFLGHKFTEEEKDILLNGKRGHDKIMVDDLWSAKKKKKFSAVLSVDKKSGRIKMTFVTEKRNREMVARQ